jgi:hypothetical protein
MDPRSWFSSLTGYFVYILSVATLGPLLFGFHLVGLSVIYYRRIANTPSLSLTRPKMSSAVNESRSSLLSLAPASRNASK